MLYCFIADWLADHGLSLDFEEWDVDRLAECLRRFYGDLLNRKGGEYSKSSLINIRAGLNRHITSPPWNRQINLMRDRGFQTCNQVFTGILRDFRERGLDVTQHKEALTAGDVKRAYSSGTLGNDDPVSLQLKVYFEIALHCARRGCEGLRELGKDSFVVKVDENDREYVTIRYHELEKNHQGLNKREQVRDPRMYAQNDENCPVKSFRKYVSALNPNCDAFFQRTNPQFKDSGIWYQNAPLGKNKIALLMKTISKKAGLSKLYTNHCLRVTSVTVLSRNDVCAENICSVTGHQNVDSVRAYVEKPTDAQRFNMSRYLHGHGKPPAPSTSNAVTLAPTPALPPATAGCAMSSVEGSSSTSESAVVPFNDRSTSPPSPSSSTSVSQCVSANAQNINLERLTHSLFSGVTLAPNSNPV